MDRHDFSDLTALFVMKTPGQSHTGLLLDASAGIMERWPSTGCPPVA
jgi:hypothetical protein